MFQQKLNVKDKNNRNCLNKEKEEKEKTHIDIKKCSVKKYET